MVGRSLYTKRVDESKAPDWKADITIASRDPFTGEEEAIHIEGAARYVIPMFERTLEMLNATHEDYVKRGLVKDYREEHVFVEEREAEG